MIRQKHAILCAFLVLSFALSLRVGFCQAAAELTTSQQPGTTSSSSGKAATRNSGTSITPSTSGRIFPPNGELLLGQGDLVHVEVFNTPEFSQDVRIDTSGIGHLSGIGDLYLESLTLEKAASLVASKLRSSGQMLAPQVTISILDYISQGIALKGEFKSAGIYPVIGPRRLSDMLAVSGGITDLSDGTAIIRHGNGALQTVSLWNDGDSVWLNPGDQITAVRAGLVYIVGNVQRPGGFPLNRPTTIVQALTLAQGLKPSTAENSVQVFRLGTGPSGRVRIPVRLHDILKGQAADFALAPEDIVYIPGSPLKAGIKIGATAAIAFATQAAVYTIPR